jgi:hypothetical protein
METAQIYKIYINRGMNNRPVASRSSERQFHPMDMNNKIHIEFATNINPDL